MSEPLQLLVGLGNPGPRYEQTRHNAGADFIEQLARQLHCPLKEEKRFSGLHGRARIGSRELHLLVPTTFMNLSGQAVQALASYFRIPVESILVAHDDLDLPPGVARLKRGGGHGGHNGLRDIIGRLGGANGFLRLRLGIGHPGTASEVARYVLQKAPPEERLLTESAIRESLDCLPLLLEQGLSKAQTRLHSFKA